MKKTALFIAAFAALMFSCKPEPSAQGGGETNPDPGPDAGVFMSIKMDKAFADITMAVNAEGKKIPLSVSAVSLEDLKTPVEVSITSDLSLKTDPEGIISCTLMDDGVFVRPESEGVATLTISPKNATGGHVTCVVTVTAKPAEPASVSIVKSSDAFTDGKLRIKEGGQFQLEAVVLNDKDVVTFDYPVKWSVISGSDYVNVDAGGLVTAKATDNAVSSASVLVEVDGYPSLTDNVTVEVQSAPTGISLSGSGAKLNDDGELIMKVGNTATLTVEALPKGAYSDFESSSDSPNTVSVTFDGTTLTVKGLARKAGATKVTLQSRHNSSVKKDISVYVFDYEEADLKPGDYVYYAPGSGGGFISTDCGLRYADGASSVYVDAKGKRTSTPKGIMSVWSGFYVGVVVNAGVDIKLDCNLLKECKDGSKAENLYELRFFDKDNLVGIGGVHALVLRRAQSSEMIEWQHNNEFIAICTDKKDGIYQSQLNGYLAFSQNDMTNGWRTESGGSTQYHYFEKYSKCGFVPYLLQLFYTRHLNNSNYSVLPAIEIDGYTDVPKPAASGKGSTGWFLPGELEWEIIAEQVAIVNKSLEKSGGTPLSGVYWSTEESGEYNAIGHTVNGNKVSIASRYKDTRTHSNGSAYARAVMYL